ncbi:MAG: nucleoside-diphosphate kinase [Candidatus Neomarinimicrobiota bacterium]|jgi:nucleoside-diphosphate kinase|nr:nucleoside-diphosphate kinase [Candidatus Neomarinimicrobiota bacterium]MDD3966784.1 nucleoside-diphosphate kinase [Candidatus Neomarinimicrobiota bacterium]MDX9779599.1 nucleoside-diphosphate kinase [bacterium]
MTAEQTLALIKPDAMEKKLQGKIIDDILNAGFTIKTMKMLQLSKEKARKFYAVHQGKEFYAPLVAFMTSGPVIALLLEKVNAIEDYRNLMGKTDPAEAVKGSLREKYGESTRRNAVHGSDSPENAKKEIAFFF